MTQSKDYAVRAVHCDHRATDDEVYEALVYATAPLTRVWDKLAGAKRIAIKFNQDWPIDTVVMYAGQPAACEASVARATLRLLRGRPTPTSLRRCQLSRDVRCRSRSGRRRRWPHAKFDVRSSMVRGPIQGC